MQMIFADIFVPQDFAIRLLLGSVDPLQYIKYWNNVLVFVGSIKCILDNFRHQKLASEIESVTKVEAVTDKVGSYSLPVS